MSHEQGGRKNNLWKGTLHRKRCVKIRKGSGDNYFLSCRWSFPQKVGYENIIKYLCQF
jgi:hypothetical protein